MSTYTDSDARKDLDALLEKALREGEARIRRADGRVFVIRPEAGKDSPLDVEGVDLGLTAEEVVAFVREGRREN
jgi:hypothetical protein